MTLPRLIIVDDEEQILRLLLEFLEDYDEFRIQGLVSAEEGLAALAEEPADLCLVDMRLPGMDGEDFILAAREHGLCKRFILHTGSVGLALSEKLLEAGLTEQDVFFKPADMGRLLARIRSLLQTREP